MHSYWEQINYLTVDHVIIGAGITGLSVAAEIIEKRPHDSIVILEKDIFSSGASTRNAGFACFGSFTEVLEDLELRGVDESLQLIKNRVHGLEILRNRLGDDALEYHNWGGYDVIREAEFDMLEKLDWVNSQVKNIFGQTVYKLWPHTPYLYGFETVKNLVFNDLEGQLDPAKMIASLTHYVQERGVKIYNGQVVVSIDDQAVITQQGTHFKTKKIFVCTNGFTKQLLPDYDVKPGRGLVLVTEPIENLPWKGTFHYDRGYFYFRNHGNRIILGGGRNLDKNAEETWHHDINEQIQSRLISDLQTMITPNKSVKIAHWWTGIMAFGEEKTPLIQKINNHTIIGVRLSGMGVALGSYIAKKMIDLCDF